MKKILLHISILIGFTACDDFCCDCDKNFGPTGNFRLIQNWEKLWADMEKPEKLDVYFFHPVLAPSKETVYTDTNYFDLPAGNYHLLALNTSGSASYSGLENYFTAQINLPVQITDSSITTVEAPLNLASEITITVNEKGKNECVIYPTPLNKVINFTFIIHTPVKALNCRAEIEGVQTTAQFFNKQPVYSAALLPFETKKIKENTFYKSLSTLGLATGSINLLNIQILCDNGIRTVATVDLTGKFNFTTAPVQNCTVEIKADTATATVIGITITDWETGADGNINLTF